MKPDWFTYDKKAIKINCGGKTVHISKGDLEKLIATAMVFISNGTEKDKKIALQMLSGGFMVLCRKHKDVLINRLEGMLGALKKEKR